IPEGIPREHYERITYAYAERARIDDYAKGKKDDAGRAGDDAEVAALAKDILAAIEKQPLYYTDIAERFATYNFNTVARAIGHLHTTEKLWQDSRGRMCVRGSQFAAKPPGRGADLNQMNSGHDRAAVAACSLSQRERGGVRGYRLSIDPIPLTPTLSPY